ncbi:scavenger receptor cysteine-rich domain superfamily protein-like isoform X2 [Mya arenaria]|uniref:scavenger receptor cysteine-rich domain superfamily protein-like isoform X2 n=1 Tax=Mya arenaria TaxID=6604 RepID=UPI0022E30946|nr:scavenger receptor cysteine-rich domain superfamily protein-like isoform X2 [Mya arenaria]
MLALTSTLVGAFFLLGSMDMVGSSEVRITGGKDFLGVVQFYENGKWNSLCADGFGRKDANVVCRQLGFKNGMALNVSSEKISNRGFKARPNISCAGNERSILECKYDREGRCKERRYNAGVLCYNQIKPTVRMNGTSNSGVVEIQVDNNNYTFCESLWGTRLWRDPSSRTCRLFGFNGGQGRIYPNGDRTMLAVSFSCSYHQRSIFSCSWSFKDDSKCLQENSAAGVVCYKNVRISGGWENDTMIAGVVEVYHPGCCPLSRWLTMSPTSFGEREALVVCRELGFSYSKLLPLGLFGSKRIPIFHQFNCSGNETNFADCDYVKVNQGNLTTVNPCYGRDGKCYGRLTKTYEYSSIVCSIFPIGNTGIKVLPVDMSPSIVYVEKDGIKGVIYPEDWDNNDAQVMCQQQGYKTGVALGPLYAAPRYPYWMSKVKCDGTEGHIENCKFDETPPPWKDHSFRDLRSAAQVHCTNGTGVDIQLLTETSTNAGMVKVSVNGEWGVICDSDWTNMDARVACRQLGFKDGLAGSMVVKPLGTGPLWLREIECSGDEKSIFSCPGQFFVAHKKNPKYAKLYLSCLPYVFCTDQVRIQPNATFGAIQVWDRDNFHLVCAEKFDDLAAQAVCRSFGFAFGKSICCSAFGRMEYDIVYSNIKCTGIESDLLECDYVKYFPNCTSGHYASVACSNLPENEDYELKIHRSGKVTTRHFDNSGFVCANGFDDAEATVICKEMGYKGGSAYFHSRHTKYSTVPLLGVPWLANIACKGTEEYLGNCEKNDWGLVGSCDENKIPAVYCFNKTGFSFALVNGTDKDSGLVVFIIDDKEGAICLRDSVIEERQKLAAIVCKQLGYGHGSLLLNGTDAENEVDIIKRFPGQLDLFITKVKCNGNESSLAECTYRILEDWSSITEDWIPVAEYDCNTWACMRAKFYNRGNAIVQELSCWEGKRRLAVKCFP